MMIWAHRPHGIRTRGKKASETCNLFWLPAESLNAGLFACEENRESCPCVFTNLRFGQIPSFKNFAFLLRFCSKKSERDLLEKLEVSSMMS